MVKQVIESPDFAALQALCNAAYKVELGESGVAFKNTDRLVTDLELVTAFEDGRLIVAYNNDDAIGLVVAQIEPAEPDM